MNAGVAVVTGAARGLGLGVAERLIDEGWQVVMVDRDAQATSEASRLSPDGAHAVALVGDVTDETVAHAAAAVARQRFGGVDALVNNAGIGGPSTPVHLTEPDEMRRVLEVNLLTALMMSRAVVPHMIAGGGGAIVNVTSVLGQRAEAGSGAYSASKAGLTLLGQAMALELAPHNIRVNSVAPGNMLTAMHQEHVQGIADRSGRSYDQALAEVRATVPLGRHGTGEDIGNVVAWLLSDQASYLTGQTLAVNGGILLS